MSVIARQGITLSWMKDIKKTYRFYKLQSATLNPPAKPTSAETIPPSGWSLAEPEYDEAATNSLYHVDLTVFSDDTFAYSDVSKDTSYEASNVAMNTANTAQTTANKAQSRIDAGEKSSNLLMDVYASSISKVNAPNNRYFSDSTNTSTICSFIAEAGLPDPNATHFVRINVTQAGKGRALCFYNAGSEKSVPVLVGETYRASCYARSSDGCTLRMGFGSSRYVHFFGPFSDGKWTYCEYTFTIAEGGLATNNTGDRFYFYNLAKTGANTLGILDMCGFRIERVTKDLLEVQEDVAAVTQFKVDIENNTVAASVVQGNIVNAINLSTEGIQINASKLNINGIVSANDYFKINTDGSFETIRGKIGDIHIIETAVYSGSKNSFSSSNQGFYLGSTGDFALGDGTAYLKWDAAQQKLNLNVTSLTIGGALAATESYVDTEVADAHEAAVNAKETGLGWKVNHTNFAGTGTAGAGECYLHGYSEKNEPADAAGWVMWNGNKVTIPKGIGAVNPNTKAPYNTVLYVVYRIRSNDTAFYNVWRNGTSWKAIKYSGTTPGSAATYTWDEPNDIILAMYVMPSSEGSIQNAQLFTPPKKYSELVEVADIHAEEAAKTATNYIHYSSTSGLVISADASTPDAGYNTQILSTGIQFRNDTTVLASISGSAFTIYQPGQTNPAMLLDADSLRFYKYGTTTVAATLGTSGLEVASGKIGGFTTNATRLNGHVTDVNYQVYLQTGQGPTSNALAVQKKISTYWRDLIELTYDGRIVCNGYDSSALREHTVLIQNGVISIGNRFGQVNMQYETNVGLQVTYGLHVMTQRHYEELTAGELCDTEFVLSGLASGTGTTLVIDSEGIVKRTSSSKRYKDHICSYTLEEAKSLLSLPVVRFQYKDGYLMKSDPMDGKSMPGFYAEDVAEIIPEAAIYNADGQVEDWNYRILIPAMLKLIQDMHKELEALHGN